MIATIIVIVEKNSSAIVAIDGFHMTAAIATIAEKVNEYSREPGLDNIVSAIRQIQHGGCESLTPT